MPSCHPTIQHISMKSAIKDVEERPENGEDMVTEQPQKTLSVSESLNGVEPNFQDIDKFNKYMDRNLHIARNTFMGVTSLKDFIERLDLNPSNGTTCKSYVCEAFAALAAEEAETLQGHYSVKVYPQPYTCSIQCRLKLGITSLHSFLRSICFDDDDFTSVVDVMLAFRQNARTEMSASEKLIAALQFESASDEFLSV